MPKKESVHVHGWPIGAVAALVPESFRARPDEVIESNSAMSAFGVRRERRRFPVGGKSHPANAPAGSNRSSHGRNEVAEAFG